MSFSQGADYNGPVAAINVTPLVDVMLVLLVIFMITAPMLQQGVEVNLPKATTGPVSGSSEQVVISIDKQGQIYVGAGNQVSLEDVGVKLQAVLALRKDEDKKVFIKADKDLPYGDIMTVMSKLHQVGITQIGLVSSPVEAARAAKG